jgi:hypothetical protein
MTPNERKEMLKNKFGDKYLEFMNDLSNVSLTHISIGKKWGIDDGMVGRYVQDLGYAHTGKIKRLLRIGYRVQQRVKARQETSRQIMEVLKRRKNLS